MTDASPIPASPDVLVVEDQDVTGRALSLLLRLSGYKTAVCASAEEALRTFRRTSPPAIALVDLDLPGMNGLDLIGRLRELDSSIYTVLLTAADENRVSGLGGGTIAYMQKPVNFDSLLRLLHQHDGFHGGSHALAF